MAHSPLLLKPNAQLERTGAYWSADTFADTAPGGQNSTFRSSAVNRGLVIRATVFDGGEPGWSVPDSSHEHHIESPRASSCAATTARSPSYGSSEAGLSEIWHEDRHRLAQDGKKAGGLWRSHRRILVLVCATVAAVQGIAPHRTDYRKTGS